MDYKIAVLPGDGIGPEIIQAACQVLNQTGQLFGHTFQFTQALIGGAAIEQAGQPLPLATIQLCQNSDAVLLGAVGGPKWDHLPGTTRPEAGLLGIRQALGLFANLRPVFLLAPLKSACPLKSERIAKGLDILIVRELTGGLYFGERGLREIEGETEAYDTLPYRVSEISRIGQVAFKAAKQRRNHVTSVDKANVLETSRLWRRTMHQIKTQHAGVTYQDMLVDNAAMQLINDPGQFDVMVMDNMFGDILSDEASMLTGSIGMLPSASLNSDDFGLYEPSHGSAPQIAGQNIANPLATILSAAMMLKYSFGLADAAGAIEAAVVKALESGLRTPDIYTEGMQLVGTEAITNAVTQNLAKN